MELKDKRYNDIRLIFHEEEHKYNDSLGNDYISTTTILHGYQPKFDKNYWLRKKSKELGISEKKLEEQWSTITKEACERGTNTHNGLEDGVKGASMFQQAINYLDKRKDGVMVTIADIPNFGANYKLLNLKDFIELTDNRYPLIYDAFKMYTERGYKIYSEIGMFLIDWLISGIYQPSYQILNWYGGFFHFRSQKLFCIKLLSQSLILCYKFNMYFIKNLTCTMKIIC